MEKKSYTYDTIGNPTGYGGLAMTWQQGRRLKTVTGTGLSASYTYNDSGIRTSKAVGGATTAFTVSGSSILRQAKGSETIDFFYDASGRLYGFKLSGTEYFYIRNGQNDIIGIINASGTQVVAYAYDAWGNPISTSGTLASTVGKSNPFRYRGYYFDEETGFYYLNSRYYDPALGRFINGDSILNPLYGPIGMNSFAYGNNNPVNMVDPNGTLPFLVVTAVVGAVVGAVAGGVIAAANGGNVWAGIGIGAAAGALIGTGVGAATGIALAGSMTATTGAVMAGGTALAATVSAGGLGAGATFVANNISQVVNRAAPAAQTGAGKMANVVEKGKAGEAAANITKNTTHITSPTGKASYRVPDMLTDTVLGEVKNYSGTLYNSPQLKDYLIYAKQNGLQMQLHTNASLANELQGLVNDGTIQLFPLLF